MSKYKAVGQLEKEIRELEAKLERTAIAKSALSLMYENVRDENRDLEAEVNAIQIYADSLHKENQRLREAHEQEGE